MSRLWCCVGAVCALVFVGACGSDSSDSAAEDSPPQTATANSFGPVSIGMTLDEATTALADTPIDTSNEHGCTYLTGRADGDYAGLIVYVADDSSRVIGIRTPEGTLTDRGVGDGSSPDQLEAAYAQDHAIEIGRFDGRIVRSTNPNEFLSFALQDGTLSAPYIGRYYWDDDCL